MQEMRKNVVILLVFSFHGNQGELRLDWPLGRNCYQLILPHQPLMSFFRCYLLWCYLRRCQPPKSRSANSSNYRRNHRDEQLVYKVLYLIHRVRKPIIYGNGYILSSSHTIFHTDFCVTVPMSPSFVDIIDCNSS